MKLKKLGSEDIQIAPIVLGGNVFGWTIDEKKSFEILDAFVDRGFNCIDTADVYSNWIPGNEGGESESIIGKWLVSRKKRDQIIIASKVGLNFKGTQGLKKDNVLKGIEGSLKRLQTDFIDLFQAHQDDSQTALEETLEAFESIRKSGKARVLGASNYSAQRLTDAINTARKNQWQGFQTFQPQYNLYDRQGFEEAQEKVCVENNLSVITYYSLASGFLSGKYRNAEDISKSARGEGIKNHYMNERGARILKALDEVSEDLRATPGQISLAWLLHRPAVTAPIVSATQVEQLDDILKASQIRLSPDHLSKLNLASEWE